MRGMLEDESSIKRKEMLKAIQKENELLVNVSPSKRLGQAKEGKRVIAEEGRTGTGVQGNRFQSCPTWREGRTASHV